MRTVLDISEALRRTYPEIANLAIWPEKKTGRPCPFHGSCLARPNDMIPFHFQQVFVQTHRQSFSWPKGRWHSSPFRLSHPLYLAHINNFCQILSPGVNWWCSMGWRLSRWWDPQTTHLYHEEGLIAGKLPTCTILHLCSWNKRRQTQSNGHAHCLCK